MLNILSLRDCRSVRRVLRRAAVCGQVRRKDVHIVAAAHRLLLLLYLHGVQVGDLPLDHFDGLVLVDASDVHGHHDIPVRLHEVGEDTVVHLRRQNLQEGHRPVPLADAEGAGLPEVEGGRRNEVPLPKGRWPGASPIQRRNCPPSGGGCCKAAPAVPFRPAHEPPRP